MIEFNNSKIPRLFDDIDSSFDISNSILDRFDSSQPLAVSTLSQAIDEFDLEIAVSDVTVFVPKNSTFPVTNKYGLFYVHIGSEIILIDGVSNEGPDSRGTLHVCSFSPDNGRGCLDSDPDNHERGALVQLLVSSGSHILITSALAKIESSLLDIFNYSTGHDHSGAMKGAPIPSSGIQNNAITEPKLDIANSPSNGKVLSWSTVDDKFKWITMSGGGGGSGLLELNGLTDDPQFFDTSNDTNVTISVSSVVDTHTFSLGWTGTLSLARGGTGNALVDPAASTLMGWDDTDNLIKFITIGSGLTYTHATHTLSASGGSPGGSDTYVQFNDGSAFGGDSGFTYNKTTDTGTIGSLILATTGGLKTSTSAGNTLLLQAYDVDGATYTTFATLTANNTPTFDLASTTTIGTAAIYRVGGTDVSLADGGTGASLADPGADRILFWDDSGSTIDWLTVGGGLAISGTTLSTNLSSSDISDFSTAARGLFAAGTALDYDSSTGTYSFDSTEINDTTWGDNSDALITWVLNPSGTGNPTLLFSEGAVELDNASLTISGGAFYCGAAGVPGNLILFDGSAPTPHFLTITVASGVTDYFITFPTDVSAANDNFLVSSTAGDISYKSASTLGLYKSGGTDVALADGGTGASLADPGADTLMGWDDTDNSIAFITLGTGLTYTHATHTLASTATASAGGSDTYVQFNDGGTTIGGDAGFTYNKATDTATLGSLVLATTGGVKTSTSAGNTLLLQAYDVDGTSYTTFATLTANNTPTMDLATGVTIGTAYIYRAGGTDIPVTDGGTGLSTFGGTNTLLYTTSANTLDKITTGNSSILITSGGGAPSWATDIPTAVTIGTAYIYRVGGTDVAITDGGTGASDAATALSNLGGVSAAQVGARVVYGV